MHDYEKLYEKFMNCNWFEKCGSREAVYENLDYIWGKNIADVDKNINSIKWENVCIEEDNEVREDLQINYPELRLLRNEQIEIINKKYMPGIMEKIKQAVVEKSLPEGVIKDVQYNVLMIFVCEFYSEQHHSEFFERLLEIYLSGHLPCGYKGRYRKGSILIY